MMVEWARRESAWTCMLGRKIRTKKEDAGDIGERVVRAKTGTYISRSRWNKHTLRDQQTRQDSRVRLSSWSSAKSCICGWTCWWIG